MRNILQSNITWLYGYFNKNKSLLEIFSFLMVAQSFIYSSEVKDLGAQSVSAFKIILWIMIFLIILLLQLSINNSLFSLLYGSLALAILLEVLAFTTAMALRKNATKEQ